MSPANRSGDRFDTLEPNVEILDTRFVELDPVCNGFAGVLFELRREDRPGAPYVVELTSAGTGARLLRFAGEREEVARALYRELMPSETNDPAR